MITEKVHISQIRAGDTIKENRDNEFKTVCFNNIKYDSFMGVSIFGDTYKLGYQLVERIKKVV